ncbi:MAG: RrF2 family transcriptional regulator [Anaerolineae bacterium]
MRLNTRTRYAARALLELALHYGQGPLSLADIAGAQELSEKYLESVLATLRSASLVHSRRGAQGGYELAKPPEAINLRQVYAAFEGSEPFVPCTQDPDACRRWPLCATQDVWARMYQASMEVLESTTLANLVARHRTRSGAYDYHI